MKQAQGCSSPRNALLRPHETGSGLFVFGNPATVGAVICNECKRLQLLYSPLTAFGQFTRASHSHGDSRMRMIRPALFALSMLTAFTPAAFASGLVATQSVERVIVEEGADGKEAVRFEKADRVSPGDEVFYNLDFRNEGAEPAVNVQLVMPVPSEVAYVENSATGDGADVAFSIDNGRTFAQRGSLSITVDGEKRLAKADQITHIRWTFDDEIAPNADGGVGYLAVLK